MSTNKLHIFLILTALMTMLLTGGCTYNNGDIGPLFGNWKLHSIETDDPQYAMEQMVPEGMGLFIAFQSSTVKMYLVNPEGSADNRYGNYRLEDNTLFLDFPDTDLAHGHPLLGLPDVCELQLLRLDGNRLVLRREPTPQTEVIYTFHKW